MAKYAQGYERKNSDTKNLIILFSSIVGVVVLAIVAVLIYNAVSKDNTLSYSSVDSEYTINVDGWEEKDYYEQNLFNPSVNGDAVLLKWKNKNSYYIYFYSDSDDQSTIKAVLDYHNAMKNDSNLLPIYLLNGSSISDDLKTSLGYSDDDTLSSGYLIKIIGKKVQDNPTTTNAKQAIIDLMD